MCREELGHCSVGLVRFSSFLFFLSIMFFFVSGVLPPRLFSFRRRRRFQSFSFPRPPASGLLLFLWMIAISRLPISSNSFGIFRRFYWYQFVVPLFLLAYEIPLKCLRSLLLFAA